MLHGTLKTEDSLSGIPLFLLKETKAMELKVIYKNARCAVIEIEDGGRYHTASSWTIYLNHKEAAKQTRRSPACII